MFEVLENFPAGLLGYHELLNASSELVPDPEKRRGHIELRTRFSGDGTSAHGEVQVLDEE